MTEYLYKKFRAGQRGGIDVVGFQRMTSGVLEGQVVRCFIDNYETEEMARAEHPDAEGYSSRFTDPVVSLSHLPGENDPVPGGMYPDDIGERA